jgi:uncharacterized protein (UPF0335 family)
MSRADVREIKLQFKDQLRAFVESLGSYALTDDKQWSVKGFIDVFKNVYTVSADTKIVSKIIEIHLFPKILEFAEQNSYRIVLAQYQNWYPDISFVHSDDPSIKFAVDIKTTYQDPEYPGHCNGFTLGSHGEYFINRNSKKNIQFPYSEYLGHLCIGVIYTRCDSDDIDETKIYKIKELVGESQYETIARIGGKRVLKVENLRSITSVVKDFQFFVREKWEIASDSSGSGNTANIGSITKVDDILNGNGVFRNLGEEWFDDYWMNYSKITVTSKNGKPRRITKLRDFLEYRGKEPNLAYPKAKKTKGKK